MIWVLCLYMDPNSQQFSDRIASNPNRKFEIVIVGSHALADEQIARNLLQQMDP